jgi:hypothetical protein
VIDDAVVPLSTTEVPLDPGAHELVVTAPGRLPYRSELRLAPSERRTLAIPPLALPETKVIHTSSRRFYGKLALGGGAGLLLAATGLGGYALHTYNDQFDDPDSAGPELPHCGQRPQVDGRDVCDAAGARAVDRAQLYGNTATAVGAVGLAAAITGAVLIWKSPDTPVVPVPRATPNEVGMALVGEF